MKKYAKIVVRNNSIYTDNLFTYEVPSFLESELEVGHRVLVPFGRGNKPTEAFVFEITNIIEEDIKTKEIIDILDENPIFKKEDLELVKWMKNRYLCTYIDCINLIYPKGYKVENYKVLILKLDLEDLKSIDLIEENLELNKDEKFILYELIKNKGKLKILLI